MFGVDGSLELLHAVAESCVTLGAEIPDSHPSAAVLGTTRQGSAVVVDAGGILLTVNYVVLGARSLSVTDTEGNEYPASLVAQDFASGIAVVRVEGAEGQLTPIQPGSSESLELGEDVLAVASIGGTERRAAWGAVTSLEPLDAYWEYRLDRSIGVTCMNPGLGGGPLCNRFGELVGVVSLNLGVLGRAALAIPAENFFGYTDEFLSHGRRVSRGARAWVGIFCYAYPERIIVGGLIPGGPGERAGLRVGDVLVKIDEHAIASRSQLYQALWEHRPGEVIKLAVVRDGRPQTFEIQGGDAEEFFA